MNENDFITGPFFYQENITTIEVQIYNPRLPEPGDWPIDPPPFPFPLEIHQNPVPIVDDSEPRPRTPTDMTTTHGTSRPNPPIPVRLAVGQSSSSKKEEPSVATDEPTSTDHQGGIPSETPATSTPSGLPIPMISISDSKSD